MTEQRKKLGCKACTHFHPANDEHGECRVYAPIPVRTSKGFKGMFPTMSAKKWCGDWALPEDDAPSTNGTDAEPTKAEPKRAPRKTKRTAANTEANA